MASLYRADQVGSLLRPPGSLQARDDYKEKRLTLDELRRIEDQAILEALAMQRQTDVDVFTEGEYDGSTSSVGSSKLSRASCPGRCSWSGTGPA